MPSAYDNPPKWLINLYNKVLKETGVKNKALAAAKKCPLFEVIGDEIVIKGHRKTNVTDNKPNNK